MRHSVNHCSVQSIFVIIMLMCDIYNKSGRAEVCVCTRESERVRRRDEGQFVCTHVNYVAL